MQKYKSPFSRNSSVSMEVKKVNFTSLSSALVTKCSSGDQTNNRVVFSLAKLADLSHQASRRPRNFLQQSCTVYNFISKLAYKDLLSTHDQAVIHSFVRTARNCTPTHRLHTHTSNTHIYTHRIKIR